MIKVLLFILSYAIYANESFVIEFKGSALKVESQSQKGDFVGVLVKNSTFINFIGIIKNEEKTIRRFSLKAGKTKSFQIKHEEFKRLYYQNMSPPSETLPLLIGNKDYEIPKKK